jgi:hypothetical protein
MVYVQKQVISYQIDDITADQINADQFVGTHVGDVMSVDGVILVDGTNKKIYAPNGFVGDVVGNATTVTNGVYTVGDQTIEGVKTFQDKVVAFSGVDTPHLSDNLGNQAIVISEGSESTSPRVTILGELIIQGERTVMNTSVVDVEDINITLAKNNSSSAVLVGSGLTLSGGTGDDVTFVWSSSNTMTLNSPLDISNGDVRIQSGDLTVSGDVAARKAAFTDSVVTPEIQATVVAQDNTTLLNKDTKSLTVDTVVAPSITGDVTGTVSDISNHTTNELAEGTQNLYYTDTRVHEALSAGVGVHYNGSGEFSIGQEVETTSDVTFNALTASSDVVVGGDVSVSGGRVYVKGDPQSVGVELYSEQTNGGALRFHTKAGQTAFISTTEGNAPITVTTSLLWVRAINGGSGDAMVDGDLEVKGTLSGPTITALQASASADLEQERQERIAGDNLLQTNIDSLSADLATETANRIAADDAFTADLATEQALRDAQHAEIQGNIEAESNARQVADANTLTAANNYTDIEIANLVASAPTTLDTLNEIAQALGNDPNLATTLTNQIAGVQANLDAEIATTNSEVTALQDQDVILQNNIDTEAANRVSGDATLQGSINTVAANLATETTNRESADTTLQSNIDTEAATRASADTTLQNNIDTVASDLAAEISATNADVSGLSAQDAILQSNIDAEEAARISGDSTLQTNIDTEATTRAADDATLQANIDALETALQNEINATNADVSTLQAADTTLQSNIDTVAANLATEISTTNSEVSALQAQDQVLQANIDTEEAARISSDNALTSAINLKLAKAEFGTYHDAEIASTSVGELSDVDLTGIQSGQILKWDGSKLAPGTDQEDLSNNSTDDLSEGTSNLYYTDSRVGAYLATTDPIAIGGKINLDSGTAYIDYDTATGSLVFNSLSTLSTDPLVINQQGQIVADYGVVGDLTGDVLGTVSDLSNHTTDALNEGSTNVYFTNFRARQAVSATGDLSYDSATGIFSFTERTDSEVTALADAAITATLAGDVTIGGDLIIDEGAGPQIRLRSESNVAAGIDFQNGGSGSYAYIDSTNGYGNDNLQIWSTLLWARAINGSTGKIKADGTIESTGGFLGNVTGTVSDISNHDTDALSEGTANLYYTDTRVGDYLTANGYALQTSVDTVAADLATEISTTNSEITALQSQDTVLQGNIDAEETARIAGDASTLSSAQSYTDSALASLVNSAPTTLDTLNEIAAALGDDPNFATTITTSIGTKLATADFDSTFDTRLATKTTSDLTEGTNLYYTDARVASYLSSGASIDINAALATGDITIDAGGDEAKLTFVLETNGGADTGSIIFTRNSGGADIGAIKYIRSQDALNFYTNGTTSADVTINSSGTLVANNGITGNLTGNVTGTVSDISNHDTGALAEGTNLYYTDARVDARIAAASVTDLSDVDQTLATTSNVSFDSVKFTNSTSSATLSEDNTYETIGVTIGDGTNSPINLQGLIYGKATQNLNTGDVLYFAGVQGDHILFTVADMSSPSFDPTYVVGICNKAINANDFGYAVTDGVVVVNTSTLQAGDVLYLDPNNAGQLTTTVPTYPEHIIQVAVVTRAANDGKLQVRFTHINDIDELANVSITNIADGQILTYNKNSFAWENTDLPTYTTSDISEGTNLYFTDERVDDRVSQLLQAGTNITLSYDDVGNTLTINSSGGLNSISGTTNEVTVTEPTTGNFEIGLPSTVRVSNVLQVNTTSTAGALNVNGKSNLGGDTTITGRLHTIGEASQSFNGSDNGTSANQLDISKSVVYIDEASGNAKDIYLSIPTGSDGQELTILIVPGYTGLYTIYIEDTNGGTVPTNINGTAQFGSYNRSARLRYSANYGLWFFVGGDAFMQY